MESVIEAGELGHRKYNKSLKMYFQNDYFSGKKCCCPSEFEGDEYSISFQTLNSTWARNFADSNSKQFKDGLKFYQKELKTFLVGPAFSHKLLSFELIKFKRGPKNVSFLSICFPKKMHFLMIARGKKQKNVSFYGVCMCMSGQN